MPNLSDAGVVSWEIQSNYILIKNTSGMYEVPIIFVYSFPDEGFVHGNVDMSVKIGII